MIRKKILSIFFVCVLLSTTVLAQQASAQQNDRIIDKLWMRLFKYSYSEGPIAKILFNPFKTPWKAFMFMEPTFWTAKPDAIDFTYLNKTEITIGMPNSDNTGYKLSKDQPLGRVQKAMDFEFAIDIIGDLPEDSFTVYFDPSIVSAGGEGELKTKLVIISNLPENAAVSGDFVIRVNVTQYTTFANLYVIFFPVAFFAPWGAYSGKRYAEDPVSVDILVKINRFHLAEIVPPENIEVRPNEIVSLPIEIKNLGSHKDTFNFRASSNADSGLIISPPSAITLDSNEAAVTYVSVATPRNFQDPGSIHPIYLEAYSIYEPDKLFKQTVAINTKGIYVSEISGIYSIAFLILISLGVAFILYRRKNKLDKICKKPNKPWELLEEKQYLDELKKKDKKEYNEVLKMMGDEYKSALLWYKYHLKTLIQKEKQKKQKEAAKKEKKILIIIKPFKKLLKKFEKKQKVKKFEEKKPDETKEVKVEETKIDEGISKEDMRKKETMERIKREQDKQRKKFKSTL